MAVSQIRQKQQIYLRNMALLAVFAGEIAKRRQKIIFAVGVRGEPSFFICVLNPVKYTDPDGKFAFIPLLINAAKGAAVGAALDYAKQVGQNFAEGKTGKEAFTDIDMKELGIASGLGALSGVGLGFLGAMIDDKGNLPSLTESLPATTTQTTPTTVIGRLPDLGNLPANEKSLIDRLPDQGNAKGNWIQNSSVLRQEMGKGLPIKDVSPGNTGGNFLNSERSLLEYHGWTFDPKTNYWMPPGAE
jgi:hypothetical protein